jgi:hypothetical protein
MAPRLIRSDVDRTRLFLGWMFLSMSTILAGALAWFDIRAGRVTVTGVVFFAIFGGLFFLGRRLLRPRESFAIDAEQRTYAVIRKGVPAESGPLDDLGPLEVQQRVYQRDPDIAHPEKSVSTPRISYAVCGAVHSDLDFYKVSSVRKARRRMEALARAWRLPSRSYGGAVRGPDELDVPLHERLRNDPESRKETALPPGMGVHIEPLSLGYAMKSTRRVWTPLLYAGGLVAILLFSALRRGPSAILAQWREISELQRQVVLPVAALLALGALWLLWNVVRDTFFPGTVLVTDRGVSYRGSRMSFAEIEEIVTAARIELIGDRKSLLLGETFCAPADASAVAHELQRLIIEVAEAYPHARSA